MDKTSIIFGNEIDRKTIKQATKTKNKYIRKFGDDSNHDYKLGLEKIEELSNFNAYKIVEKTTAEPFFDNGIVIGNIRMGFGHYRISMAIASCAAALGYIPLWFDLTSFNATGSKMINEQNKLYSLASRISQKSKLFNYLIWDPLNCKGFKKITYNAKDQKNSELLVPLYQNMNKDIPFIATHVWPAQGAVHSNFTHVVNAIPDNWPMGLHLAEGSIHTVQTPYAYAGYLTLNGFAKKTLKPMPKEDLKMVGHYVDHELLINLEKDNANRRKRIEINAPIRMLLTIGGAGAGYNQFKSLLKYLKPYIDNNKIVLFINFGDHLSVYEKLCKDIEWLKNIKFFNNQYQDLVQFINEDDPLMNGAYAIYHENIFEAVYSTNLLMHISDLLLTKPSELAYYPIPKLFMHHIGGHEVYGAIHGRELGDALAECEKSKDFCAAIDSIMASKGLLLNMINEIERLKKAGYYDGGYEVVRLAVGNKNEL